MRYTKLKTDDLLSMREMAVAVKVPYDTFYRKVRCGDFAEPRQLVGARLYYLTGELAALRNQVRTYRKGK